MKNHMIIMKTRFISKVVIALAIVQLNTTFVQAQSDSTAAAPEKPKKDTRPVKDMFESGYLLNNQTAMIPTKHTLEMVIQHRFGLLNSKEFDLGGIYAPSNIRIGFNFSLSNKLQLGFGTTKNNKLQDLTWKYAIIKQTRSGSIPVSITYYGNAAIDCRSNVYPSNVDRMSYFHQLIIARKFGSKLSLQISPSFSHFNMVDSLVKHNNIGVSFNGRFKLSDALAVIFEYDYNTTKQDSKVITVKPNIGIGIEAATSNHVFQIFISSGQAIINQHNMLYNANDFTKKAFCIGFNMTRLWNY